MTLFHSTLLLKIITMVCAHRTPEIASQYFIFCLFFSALFYFYFLFPSVVAHYYIMIFIPVWIRSLYQVIKLFNNNDFFIWQERKKSQKYSKPHQWLTQKMWCVRPEVELIFALSFSLSLSWSCILFFSFGHSNANALIIMRFKGEKNGWYRLTIWRTHNQ